MMKTLFEITSTLLQLFIWTWFISKFLGFKNDNCKAYKYGFLIMCITAFVQTYFINKIVLYDGFLTSMIVITYFMYARICLKGSCQHQLFLVLFSTAVLFTISSVVILFISYIFGVTTESLIGDFTYRRVIVICLCRILEFITYKSIIKINAEYKLTKKEWILFTAMPLLTWIGETIMMKLTIADKEIATHMFYLSLTIVVIDIITIFFSAKIKIFSQNGVK